MMSFRGAALAAAAAGILGAASPGIAQPLAGPQSVAPAPARDAYIPYGPVCDRRSVRECQAAAKFEMTMCEPLPGRFICADRILAEQSACFAATGCY